MNDLDKRITWLSDTRRILDLFEAGGLPFPHVSQHRVSFHFAGTSAPEASEAMLAAETILAAEFGVTFGSDWTRFGSMRHYIRRAQLPSGVALSLVTAAIRFDDLDGTAPEREMATVA